MTDTFHHPPTPEILTRLAQGSLRQQLPRATRLWAILHSLYGDEETRLNLPKDFTYNDWRNAFFDDASQHPSDKAPKPHSDTCPCAHSLSHWLFNPETGVDPEDWHDTFQRHYPGSSIQDNINAETRLFATTGKSLKGYLDTLAQQGFLEETSDSAASLQSNRPRTYRKRKRLPNFFQDNQNIPTQDLEEAVRYALKTELAGFFKHLGKPIRDVQRLFINLEYIIPNHQTDRMEQLQALLRDLWEQDITSPIQVRYRSARLGGEEREFITYPVCLHYFQRAPYLYGWGNNPLKIDGLDWYDFRLDRCFKITPLSWDDPAVDPALRDRCLGDNPPSPEDVRDRIIDVWGYDIYMPEETLLLRFNREFYQSYVEGTERESRLVNTTARRRTQLINNANLPAAQRQKLLNILEHHPKDVYREAQFRQGDRNIIMRLRAWGPMVEVLLPTTLRQQMADDMKATQALYED